MEIRTEVRRELGLPTEPPGSKPEQPNAPKFATAEVSQTAPLPHAANDGSGDGNTDSTTTNKSYADKANSRWKINQTPTSNQGRGKKNKEHQSPIKSPSSQSQANALKKVRVFSPKSVWRLRKTITGNLFVGPDTCEKMIVSSVVWLAPIYLPKAGIILTVLIFFLLKMLIIVIADSRGRHLDIYVDHKDIKVTFESGARLLTLARMALEIIDVHRPDTVLIMAWINDLTCRNRFTGRVRLLSTNPSVLASHLIQRLNQAKSIILASHPEIKIVFGGIMGM